MTTQLATVHVKNFSQFWQQILFEAQDLGALTQEEFSCVINSHVCKVLTFSAFRAECTDPENVAVEKLLLFLDGIRHPERFYHRKGQTIQERLAPGMTYDGNQRVVNFLENLLTFWSFKDHLTDMEQDLKRQKYNPIVGGDIPSNYGDSLLFIIDHSEFKQEYERILGSPIKVFNGWI